MTVPNCQNRRTRCFMACFTFMRLDASLWSATGVKTPLLSHLS